MLTRKNYLDKMIKFKDPDLIKIIVGVRRSGKSTLLKQFRDHLLEQFFEEQVLFFTLEYKINDVFRDGDEFYRHLKEQITEKETYVLIDEIQMVRDWQRVVASILAEYPHVDIYITGSNAHLLSGELATNIAGRYVQIPIYPLSFNEYLEFKRDDPSYLEDHFYRYITEGGFPKAVLSNNQDLQQTTLRDIFSSIVLYDIMGRGEVRDQDVFLRVIHFLLDNIGNIISINNIVTTLRSDGIKTTHKTVSHFLYLLEQAFFFYKVQRYNIRGKELLRSKAKYYVVDTGIRNAQLAKSWRDNTGSQIENIVFIELKRRGYDVSVGDYSGKEIDFIARNHQETIYYQVTRQLPENSTRETDNLLHLPDNYKKMIITANRMDVGSVEGIEIIHVIDFLRKD